MRKLNMVKSVETKELVEGHPLKVSKIIKGDLRTISLNTDNGQKVIQKTDGTLLYDKTDKRDRPWFILAYESGKRVVD